MFDRGCDWGKGATEDSKPARKAPMTKLGWRPFVYGGIASCAAELGTFPIDTSKTRLQIQGQQIDSQHTKLKYTGMTNALVTITKEEGFKSLYNGLSPALLRQATYGTIKFGIYYSLKNFIMSRRGGHEEVPVNVLCGVVAGVVSSCIANPTDVLKVRMQVAGRAGLSENIVSGFKNIYRNEGLRGLWRGVGPTAQRAALIAAVELPIYDYCKDHLIGRIGDNVTNHFISSFIASLGATVATTPIDVCRTRIMNQRVTTDGTLYRSSVDCFLKTWKLEGPLALYRGFIPTWLRLGPWNVIFFVSYEQLKLLY